MATPFVPENIYRGGDDRWYHDGVDVTDRPVRWRCPRGLSFRASLVLRTSPHDPGCPTCWAAKDTAALRRGGR